MLILKSTNPKMSWVIFKNPQTQKDTAEAFKRPCRKGVIHGWFADEHTFKMLFIDHPSEISFSNQEFEYLDKTRYCSPYLPVSAISELLHSACNKKSEHDEAGHTHSFSFIVSTRNELSAQRLGSRLPGGFEMTRMGEGCLYKVTFTNELGIYELLNTVIVWSVVVSIMSDELYIPMDEAVCTKYARALNAIDAPYYARHTLIRCAIRKPTAFNAVRPLLENERFKLNFGNTQAHRFDGIKTHLPGGSVLYDIGCGELFYTRKLAKQYETIHAFDADPEIQRKNAARLAQYELTEQVSLFGEVNPQDMDIESGAHVLLTEVLEHMPLEKSKAMLTALAKQPFGRLVISVPNRTFNPHYLMAEGQMRHDDHHWEPTQEEFGALIQNHFSSEKFRIYLGGLGDAVDGVYASSMAVIDPA